MPTLTVPARTGSRHAARPLRVASHTATLRRSQRGFDYSGQRRDVDQFVESTGTDGIFEVVIEMGR